MSPEAQRIAIAEACGEINPRFTESGACIASTAIADGIEWGTHGVSNYLNDRNAMHEAVHKWLESAQSQYIRAEMEEMLAHQIRKILKFQHATFIATAAQLAEAYLRTLNLWNPDA